MKDACIVDIKKKIQDFVDKNHMFPNAYFVRTWDDSKETKQFLNSLDKEGVNKIEQLKVVLGLNVYIIDQVYLDGCVGYIQ